MQPLSWGGAHSCVCVCVLQHAAAAQLCGQVRPLTWASRPKAGWGWAPQLRGGDSHPPKVGCGPRHWDCGAESFQKRQLKVGDRTPVQEDGLRGRLTGLRQLAAAAGTGSEGSWHLRQNWSLTLGCWLHLVQGRMGVGIGVVGRGGSLSHPRSDGVCSLQE